MSGRPAGVPLRFALAVQPVESGVEEARQALLEQLRALPLSADQCFALELSAHEALVNALVHGVREGGGTCVMLSCEVDDECVRIVVQDDGEGFAWGRPCLALDSTECAPCPTGRGHLLIGLFMSRVWFTPVGNGIIMELDRGRGGRLDEQVGMAGSSFAPGTPTREEKGSRTPVGPASPARTRDAYAC
jgi:anti-sigma regulatory factor (Ser/Thr protein kinase)